MKIKIVAQQEFILCGYTAGERDHFGSLVLGLYEKGKLVWVGNVGTGFDQKMLEIRFISAIEPLVTDALSFRKNAPMPRMRPGSVLR